jgi:phosphoglycolate phosphatase-like HAD superfamily hydrolase
MKLFSWPWGLAGIAGVFHVGDTPMDIQAAVAAGATPIAVATGIFTKVRLACVPLF